MTESPFHDLGYQAPGAPKRCCCNGRGTVLAVLTELPGIPYAFKCVCSAGQESKRNFPTFPGEGAGYRVVKYE